MSEQDTTGDAVDAAEQSNEQQPDTAASVNKGSRVIALVIFLSLAWYLVADRFTPYTTQAQIAGYVVGVAPKVAGVVTQVWVANNKSVAQGQRLFEIDPSQYQIALDKARSGLESAERQVGAGSAAVESARANLRAAMANEVKAQQNATRLERLYSEDPGTISVRQLEGARASLAQAKAQVTAAQANIEQAIEQMGGDDETDNTTLKSAMNAVAKAELDLANTIVTASTRGIITDLRANVGQYAGTGSPVLTLVSVDDVWINAEFTENNLGHLTVGTPVEILFDAMPGELFDGEVRSISLGVGDGQATSPGTLPTIDNDRDWLRQSQRFTVVISFNTELQTLREQLRIGGQASVIAYTEGHGVLKLLGKAYIRLMSWFSYAY
jgi:multidrug resistance efflux pump